MFDGFGAFVFQGEKITFDTLRGPAVWNVRNVQGPQEHRMNAVTELLRPLEIVTTRVPGVRQRLAAELLGSSAPRCKSLVPAME